MRNYTFLLVILLLLNSCRNAPNTAISGKNIETEIQLAEGVKVELLDSTKASQVIINDNLEQFFDKITVVDMLIQMKKVLPKAEKGTPSVSKDQILAEYRAFLQRDMANFNQAEKDFTAKIFAEAFALCQKISPTVFPRDIRIIKTHGAHYGGDTYYTRENIIVVPAQALALRDNETFLRVMLHEIAHIITRLNPSVKAQLYALIGFKKIDNELVVKDSLRNRLLINPDGVEMNWATELTGADGKNVFATPLIYANDSLYRAEKPEFFQYLGWNYYELVATNANSKTPQLTVLTVGKQQKSTLNTTGINTLFKQKFNTEYIIHPDEIIADNFSLLTYAEKDANVLKTLSPEGQQLLTKMRPVLAGVR